MAFKLAGALTLVLLATLANCGNPICYDTLTRDELPKYTAPPQETWIGTVKSVQESRGSLMGRTDEMHAKLKKFRESIGNDPELRDTHLRRLSGFKDLERATEITLLENTDGKHVSSKENAFPYGLPAGVKHDILWFRTAFVNEGSFMAFKDIVSPATAANYILHFDCHGSYSIDVDTTDVDRAILAHPDKADWVDRETGGKVTYQLGLRLLDHVGDAVNKLLQKRYDPNIYQVVWNRSPDRFKSVMNPDHMHVIYTQRAQPA